MGIWVDNQASGITPGQITGLTPGAVLFGAADGSIGQNLDLFWDNASEELGIGTNAPESKLHVKAANSTLSPFAGSDFIIESNVATYTTMLSAANAQLGHLFAASAGNYAGILWDDGTRGNLLLLVGNTARTDDFVIQRSDGFVGIDQRAPLALLHVGPNGSARNLTTTAIIGGTFAGLNQDNGTSAFWTGVVSTEWVMYGKAAAGAFASTDEILNITTNGVIQTKAGLATAPTNQVNHGGTLNSQFTPVGTVGGGEDTLMSFVLPANLLGTNGDILEFEASGSYAATVSDKTIKVTWQGSGAEATLFDTGAKAITGGSWHIRGVINRATSTTQQKAIDFLKSTGVDTAAVDNQTIMVPAGTNDINTADAVTLRIKAQDSVGVLDDQIVQNQMIIKWFPARV